MNPDDSPSKREQLERAIAAQESLRGVLDEDIVDATIAALRKRLAELEPSPSLEQQRKLATVLFMDVVDSTRLLGELDPEENMAIMDVALQQLAAPVEAHGGQVTRFMGDGYLAVFGLGRARENEPEMAVRAGLEVLKTAQDIAKALEKDWGLSGFKVRVGVNTGLVVTGGVTEAEGTVMGAAVNLAARLESSAPPGRLLISQHTYQHVRGLFDLEPGEAIQAKGFAEPVQAYLVIRAKPHAFRLKTRGVEGVETPMVGREQELAALQQSLEGVVRTRESRFITVVGDAGLGKSRLLDEFERWLELGDQAAMLFKGRATLDTLVLPYALFRDLFAGRFEILDDEAVDSVRKKFVDGFRQALGEVENLERNAHFVGQLLGYDFSDSAYLQEVLDAPRQLHDRAVVYLSEYFKALAERTPVIVFLDDLHWADESSLDILLRLSRELSNQPVFFLALARPSLYERRPSWGNQVSHQRIDLQPLSLADSQRLVAEVLRKVRAVPEVLSDLITRNAEGNPYYLEELIKMLVEDGVIVKSEDVWRVQADRLVAARVPPTLTGVVQARLDALPGDERTVLQQASVVGRVFWDAAVAYIHQEAPADPAKGEPAVIQEIAQQLHGLENRELIFQHGASAFSSAAEFTFKHTILQDVTYESVLKRRRRVYHAMTADWLIAHSGERAGEVSGLIAGHLEKAGRAAQALEYMCRAAEAAAANFATEEAAEFYARALALAPESDLEKRYALYLGRERVLGMLGKREAQDEALASLTSIAEKLGDKHKQIEALIRRAWYAYWLSEFTDAVSAVQKAISLAESAGEQELIGQAYYAWAWSDFQQGDPGSALVHAERALSLARQTGDLMGEGNTHNIMGMINISDGDYYRAQGFLNQFLAIAREIGDKDRQVTALNNLGVTMTLLGNYPAARDYFLQILSIAREISSRVFEGITLANLAWLDSTQGEWASAVKYAEASIKINREVEQIESAAEGLIWLGNARLGLGQPVEASAAYQEAWKIRQEFSKPHRAMEALAGLARAALARGDQQAASERVEQIIAYLSTGGSLEGSWEKLRIYLTCYQVLRSVQDPRAWEILKEAHTLLQEQARRIPDAEARRLFLENVPWHAEIVSQWQATKEIH